MNDSQRFDGGKFTGGAILILIGSLFLFDQLDLIPDFGFLISRYWPMIIVVVGISKLWSPATLWSGLWLVALGGWMQACRLHWYGLTWNNSWPLLLIVLGGGMVLRTFVGVVHRRDDADIPREGPHAT